HGLNLSRAGEGGWAGYATTTDSGPQTSADDLWSLGPTIRCSSSPHGSDRCRWATMIEGGLRLRVSAGVRPASPDRGCQVVERSHVQARTVKPARNSSRDRKSTRLNSS